MTEAIINICMTAAIHNNH